MIASDIKIASYKGWCELQAQVKSDTAKKPFLLRYCFPPSLKEFVRSENGDPFLAALLLPAMKLHETLEIPAPVSPKLLRATDEIQALYSSWDPSLSKVRINAPVWEEENSLTFRPPRNALFFSCGVDSYYSLFKNVRDHPDDEETITDLIVVRGFDNPFQARRPSAFRTVLPTPEKYPAIEEERAAGGHELKGLRDQVCALGPPVPWSGYGERRTCTRECFSQNLHSIIIQTAPPSVGIAPSTRSFVVDRAPVFHHTTDARQEGWIKSVLSFSFPL